jgi:tetratricopeptide (TPR) repeat protein
VLSSPKLRIPALRVSLLLSLAVATLPLSAQDDFERAEALVRDGKFAEAEVLFAKIGPSDAHYLDARMRLGTIFYATGRPAEAEECFQDYLQERKTAEAYTLLAGAQFSQKKLDAAYVSAKKAVELDPRHAKAYTAVGMIYSELKDWTHADAAFREALRLDDGDASAWYLLGRSRLARNEFEGARQGFEASLKLNPQSIRAYENLGLTLELLGKSGDADKILSRGTEINRASRRPEPRIHTAYGQFLFRQGRLEESRAQFQEALRIDPRNAEPHYELARVLGHLKLWKDAAKEGEESLRLGGPDYRVHFLLSRIYTALGDHQRSQTHASEAARLSNGK